MRARISPGPRNLITDIDGLLVGNARDEHIKSGVTVLTADRPFAAAVHVMGGAPATRETDALAPDKLVAKVDALVLSGGSAFGLDAASGVMAGLRAAGRGFAVGAARVPIVPTATLFDLLNNGDKSWIETPYPALGRSALATAGPVFDLGSVGAGTGAKAGNLKGGLGSASLILPGGLTVGALVAVNAFGSVTVGDSPHFWAAPWECADEFGGLGLPTTAPPLEVTALQRRYGETTTLAIVATDADLTTVQAQRMAVAAHDGMARAILPSHTPVDGDLVFAASTGAKTLTDPLTQEMQIGHAASIALARAVARAVYEARNFPNDPYPSWQDRFGDPGST